MRKQATDLDKVIKNFFWRFFERCGAQSVTFIVSIVLARLIHPEAYGIIALVTVFSNIGCLPEFTANHGAKPNGDAFFQAHISTDCGIGRNKCCLLCLRFFPSKWYFHRMIPAPFKILAPKRLPVPVYPVPSAKSCPPDGQFSLWDKVSKRSPNLPN